MSSDIDPVVKSIERLIGESPGDFRYLVKNDPESMGGGADTWNNISCFAANFYYDVRTGEIKYFGNYQYVPEDIRDSNPQGTFRIVPAYSSNSAIIARYKEKRLHFHIVELVARPSNRFARAVLNIVMREFNEAYGVDEDFVLEGYRNR